MLKHECVSHKFGNETKMSIARITKTNTTVLSSLYMLSKQKDKFVIHISTDRPKNGTEQNEHSSNRNNQTQRKDTPAWTKLLCRCPDAQKSEYLTNLERWQKCNCHGLQKQIQTGCVVGEYDNKIWVYYKIGKMAKVSMTWITKTNAGLLSSTNTTKKASTLQIWKDGKSVTVTDYKNKYRLVMLSANMTTKYGYITKLERWQKCQWHGLRKQTQACYVINKYDIYPRR